MRPSPHSTTQHITFVQVTTMKVFLVLLSVVVACAAQNDFYETEDDKFKSNALSLDELRSVATCLNERTSCNSVTASFKKHYPEAVREGCKRCSRDHLLAMCEFYKRLTKELPDEYEAIKKVQDPTGQYWDKFYSSFNKIC